MVFTLKVVVEEVMEVLDVLVVRAAVLPQLIPLLWTVAGLEETISMVKGISRDA